MTAVSPLLKTEIDFAGNPSAGYFDQLRYQDGLVSYWRLNSGATLNDELGANNGTMTGSPPTATGALPNDTDLAIAFDGSTDDGLVDSAGTVSNPFTLEGWVKVAALPGATRDLVARRGSYLLQMDSAGKLLFSVKNDTTVTSVQSGTGVSTGSFYHVVCVYDGATVKIYINGILDQAAAHTVGVGLGLQPLRFAATPSTASPTYQSSQTATSGGAVNASITCNKPASVASGDLLIAQICHRNDTLTITPPSGWTLFRSDTISDGDNRRVYLYYKIAGGSEPASYTWTLSASTNAFWVVAISRFTGTDTTYPIADTYAVTTGSGTSKPTGSHLASVDNNLIFALFASSNGGVTWTESSGTERYDINDTVGPGNAIAASTQTQASASSLSVTGTASIAAPGYAAFVVICGSGLNRVACTLDEFSFWNVALTADQVVQHYQARLGGVGSWIDVSGDTARVETKTGRQYELNKIDPGTSRTALDDLARAYDPANPSGAYAPNVLPLRKIRHRARASAAGPALTVSGNEITDALRALGVQGDGQTQPDSSQGIWEATTNLIPNGGAETNLTGWNVTNITSARDTTKFKFGVASFKAAVTIAGYWELYQAGTISGATAGRTFTASVWLYADATAAGKPIRLGIFELGGAAGTQDTRVTITPSAGWNRFTVTRTLAQNDRTSLRVYVFNEFGTAAATDVYYVDGVQIEEKATATPYVHTDGGTASRTAARVRADSALLNATQGFVAGRLRYGAITASGGPTYGLILLGNDGTNSLYAHWDGTAWHMTSKVAGVNDSIGVNVSPVSGDLATVVAAWDASWVYLSINGAAFTKTARSHGVPSVGANLDIGSLTAWFSASVLDSDVLWLGCGTGRLTDADAAAIHRWFAQDGLTDPTTLHFNDLPSARDGDTSSNPDVTMVWPADTSANKIPTYYGVSRGFIEALPSDYEGDHETMTLPALDGFESLNYAGVDGTLAAALSGAQIHKLLDDAAWSRTDRAIDAGQFTMAETLLTTDAKALTEIQVIADSELGIFFIDANGVATYHDFARRWSNARSITSQAIFSNAADTNIPYVPELLKPLFDKNRIVNEWKVSSADGTVRTALDALSVSRYFRRRQTRSTRLDDPNDAQTIATALLQETANPALRFESLTVQPVDDTSWTTVLGLTISDRITVIHAPSAAAGGPTITKDFFIEGIAWSITVDDVWQVTFQLSPCSPSSYYDTLLRYGPVSYWRMATVA